MRISVGGSGAGVRDQRGAEACLLGDLDMVAPLRMAGIRTSIVTPEGDPARYSRRVRVLGWKDPRDDPQGLLDLLLAYAGDQEHRPVLYFQSDQHALFVSRYRRQLDAAFHLLVAEESLMEDLLDKRRFRDLAEGLGLPVPPSQVLDPWRDDPDDVTVPFPLVLKPASRGDDRWVALEKEGKAVPLPSARELVHLWPKLQEFGSSVLVQSLVAGPETRIESYHVYVDARGDTVAEFTGRKLRTKPAEFGRSTAVTITDTDDVKALGRDVVRRLGLVGVAKLDFKRDEAGDLWLLEVNPRYTLWFHPAAIAGVNIPALVWADLTGGTVARPSAVTEGVNWCSAWDAQAARLYGESVADWARWAWRCEAKSMTDWSDPLPAMRLAYLRGRRLVQRRPAS